MVWIRETEDEARREAEQRAADEAALEAEQVTEKIASTFLANHKAPLEALAQDFRNAGYYTELSDPEYFNDSWNANYSFLDRVALVREVPQEDLVKLRRKGDSPTQMQIFGIELGIQMPTAHGSTDFAKIQLIPIVGERTNFARVMYRGDLLEYGYGLRSSFAFESDSPTTPSDGDAYNAMKTELKRVVARESHRKTK